MTGSARIRVDSMNPQLFLSRFSDWLSSSRQPRALGSLLMEMLRVMAKLRGDGLNYRWRFGLTQRFPSAVVEGVAACATRAAWVLGITRRCESMFMSGETHGEKIISIQLSRSLSGRLHRTFHEAHLRAKSGAQVNLKSVGGSQSDLLKLHAEGTPAQIRVLRLELQRYVAATHMVGMPVTRASRYFMEGATLLLFEGCLSLRAQLRFRPSEGGWCVPAHALKERSTPQLNTPDCSSDWEAVALQRFAEHWCTQLAKTRSSSSSNNNSLPLLDARAHFGTFYLTDISTRLPETCRTLSVAQLQEAMVKHSRYRQLRGAVLPLAPCLRESARTKSNEIAAIEPSKGIVSVKPVKTNRKGRYLFCVTVFHC